MSPLAHVHTRALWGRHRTIKTPSLSWAGRTGPTLKLTVLIECYLHYSVREWGGRHIFFESQLHCLPPFKTILKTMPPASRPFPLLCLECRSSFVDPCWQQRPGEKGAKDRRDSPKPLLCRICVRAHVRHVSCFGFRDWGFGFRASSCAKASQRLSLCKGVAKYSRKASHGFASRLFAPVVTPDCWLQLSPQTRVVHLKR